MKNPQLTSNNKEKELRLHNQFVVLSMREAQTMKAKPLLMFNPICKNKAQMIAESCNQSTIILSKHKTVKQPSRSTALRMLLEYQEYKMSIFAICFILYFLKLSACRGFKSSQWRWKTSTSANKCLPW